MIEARKKRIQALPLVEQRCCTSFTEAQELGFCTDWASYCDMKSEALAAFWQEMKKTSPEQRKYSALSEEDRAEKIAALREQLKRMEETLR